MKKLLKKYHNWRTEIHRQQSLDATLTALLIDDTLIERITQG